MIKKRKYITIMCKLCGKEKQVRNDTHQIYCSISCQLKDSWVLGKIKAKPKSANRIQICLRCGNEFEGYDGGKKKYCSKECRYAGLKLSRICKQCGKEFLVLKSTIEHTNASGNYCSLGCYYNHGRKKSKCLNCGKNIETKKHRVGKFCSVLCSQKYYSKEKHYRWVGLENKHTTRGRGWLVIRRKVLERDNYQCQKCGRMVKDNAPVRGSAPDVANVHHITPYRDSKDNSLSNLITFCPKCHMETEWGEGGAISKCK